MRWLRLVPVAGGALALGACGGGGGGSGTPGTTTTVHSSAALVAAGLEPPAGCYVTVFLAEDVSKADIASVQRRLLADRVITQVSYVSKGLELRRYALSNPKAAKGMHVNPFADRFEVVPRTNGGVFTIVGDFATRGGPITNVKPSEGCAAGPG
jgi:FtsX extracellular domain